MLGGIYVGKSVLLRLSLDHSTILPQYWWFVPSKVALLFISRVCLPTKNDISAKFFQKMLANYKHQDDQIIGPNTPICPWFRPMFFEESPALMSGFCTLEFNSGLDYAATTSSLPAHISFWHFISSLKGLADGCIPHQGLTAHQLTQLLTNYHVCYEHIFANSRDYP